MFQHTAARRRLENKRKSILRYGGFNTQPPEGGWKTSVNQYCDTAVSTHSRPKAAGQNQLHLSHVCLVSTHSRPKAAGGQGGEQHLGQSVSTHSRPKAAGITPDAQWPLFKFQHTAARRRLEIVSRLKHDLRLFQHTAARRRLGLTATSGVLITDVSTHSRPKAAGLGFWAGAWFRLGFNTQPPEGGWESEARK